MPGNLEVLGRDGHADAGFRVDADFGVVAGRREALMAGDQGY
jgi:hypothetical protein